jgi:signal transduction histidine kinase
MRRLVVWCVLLLGLMLSTGAMTRVLEARDVGPASIALQDEASLLCEAEPVLTVREVASDELSGRFEPAGDGLIRGFTDEACWLRFTLARSGDVPTRWLLRVGKPYLDEVTLYAPRQAPDGGREFTATRLGDLIPAADRPVSSRLFVFPLDLPESGEATYYLRVRTTSTFRVENLDLMQADGLLAAEQRELPLYSFVFGIILLGMFANLTFGIRLSDAIYAYYTFYLAVLLVLNLANSGLLALWFTPHHPLIADRAVGTCMALSLFAGLAFFDKAFGLGRHFSVLRRLIPLLLIFELICALMAAFGYHRLVLAPAQAVGLLIVTAILGGGVALLLRREQGLALYMAAFTAQLMASVFGLGRNLAISVVDIPVDQIVLVGTAIHVVLLNLAVAQRIRHNQAEADRIDQHAARLALEQAAVQQEHQFMSMIAHEFRTPLAIVDTLAQRIAGRYETTDQATVDRCTHIRAAVARTIQLMDEFLDADRISERLRNMHLQTHALRDIVAGLAREFAGQQVRFSSEKAPALIPCDAPLLQVALVNLIRNALHYDPLSNAVEVRVSGSGHDSVKFEVIDQGPGIAEEELGAIFNKFVRGRGSARRAGIGLGLHLVSEIAKAHHGKVSVRSRVGEGSVFTMELPAASLQK